MYATNEDDPLSQSSFMQKLKKPPARESFSALSSMNTKRPIHTNRLLNKINEND